MNCNLEFLYDNGLKETFKTGEMTEKELEEIMSFVYKAMAEGKNAVLQFPNEDGLSALINLTKVTRIDIKNNKE